MKRQTFFGKLEPPMVTASALEKIKTGGGRQLSGAANHPMAITDPRQRWANPLR